MLGLRDQIAGDKVGLRALVGQHDDFARPRDAIDVDFSIDLPFGQRDEQVARSDDLVDLLDPFDSVRERRDPLRAAHAVDLGDAQLVTRGQEVSVVAPEIGRRHDDHDLFDAGDLRRNGRHQERRRVSSRPTGNTNSDAPQRQVALPQLDPRGSCLSHDRSFLRQQAPLKLPDIRADAAQSPQKLRISPAVSGFQFGRLHP